jgi:hypothetical protein
MTSQAKGQTVIDHMQAMASEGMQSSAIATESDVLDVLYLAIEAIEQIHSYGIAHRNLEPGSIFISVANIAPRTAQLIDARNVQASSLRRMTAKSAHTAPSGAR